jgi:hypothetical protein
VTAGRPAIWTQEMADKVCEQLAEGDSLRTVCTSDDMPSMSTVFKQLRIDPEFAQQYANAKEQGAIAMFEEMMDIADDGTNDFMLRKDESGGDTGFYFENKEALARSRLRVDTRKWALSKLAPKKYGDKIQTELSGSLSITNMSDAELDAAIKKYLGQLNGN